MSGERKSTGRLLHTAGPLTEKLVRIRQHVSWCKRGLSRKLCSVSQRNSYSQSRRLHGLYSVIDAEISVSTCWPHRMAAQQSDLCYYEY